MQGFVACGILIGLLSILVLFDTDQIGKLGYTRYLLDQLHPHAEQQEKVDYIKKEIEQLDDKLEDEIEKFQSLKQKSINVKKQAGFWWFFDPVVHAEIDKIALDINDQKRVVINISEDVEFHWKKLKAVYGVRTRVFLIDLAISILKTCLKVPEYIMPSAPISLAILLVFGPMTMILLLSWMSIGFALLPAIVSILSMHWVADLANIIIQYAPTVTEFAVIYTSCIAIVIASLALMWKASGYGFDLVQAI